MAGLLTPIDEAILLTKAEEYLRALTLFLDVYGGEDPPSLSSKMATGLSYFGLCLALVQKKMKPAAKPAFCGAVSTT